MEIREFRNQEFTVSFSFNEMVLLNNALNEICNGIDVPEFDTRIGASLDDARRLLRELHEAINRVK